MPLQFRRGTNAERLTITPAVGEPIWTTNTNLLYVGDGTTVGGIRIELPLPSTATFTSLTVTNIHFTGDPAGVDQTTAWTGTVAWSQIGSKPNGGLYTTSTVEFNQLSVTGSTIASTQSSILVNASGSTVYEQPHIAGYLVWGINDVGASARLVTDTYSGTSPIISSVWTGRKARGTAAAPSAVQSGDLILRLAGTGFGTTEFASTSSGYLEVVARENFTDGARGTQINLATTNTGTNTVNNSLRVASDGTIITAPQASATESVLLVNKTGLTSYPTPTINVDGYDIWAIREGESARGVLDAYGTGVNSNWQGRRARGTAAAPSAVQDEDILASFRGNGYGTTGYGSTSTAFINFTAVENYTDTARGSRIAFYTTLPGEQSPDLAATIRADGVNVYSTASSAYGMLVVQGSYPNLTIEDAEPGTNIQVINKPGQPGRVAVDTYADDLTDDIDKSYLTGRRARGTAQAPTQALSGDGLLRVAGYAYGTTKFISTASAGMSFTVIENVTDNAAGGQITFDALPIGAAPVPANQQIVATMNVADGLTVDQLNVNNLTINNTGEILTSNTSSIDIFTNQGVGNYSEVWIKHNESVEINTNGGVESWVFDKTGAITFPDATVQNTAWTGTVANSQITSVSTSKVTGLSVVGWTNKYDDLTGKPNQGLDTTDAVTFAGITDTGPLTVTGFSALNGGARFSAATVTNALTVGTSLAVTGFSSLSGGATLSAATVTNALTVGTNLSAGATTLQSLTVTTGTVVNRVVSSGGYPLNSAGTGSYFLATGASPSMFVTNYTAGQTPVLVVRGYGQNTPGGISSTAPNTSIRMDGSYGTALAPTALLANQLIGQIVANGYDGANWQSDFGNNSNVLAWFATETMTNSGAGATYQAGSGFQIYVQPQWTRPGVNTTRQRLIFNTWTTSSTGPSQMNLGIGSGVDATAPTMTMVDGTTYTGYGRTNLGVINSAMFIHGVPSTDSAPDNNSLTGTNVVTIVGNRRSGVSLRRNPIVIGDALGVINFNGQSASATSGSGVTGASITTTALDNFSGGTTRGTSFSIATVNSGTSVTSNRLSLSDRQNNYLANQHQFVNAGNTNIPLSFTTSTWNTSVDSQTFGNTAGTVNMLTMNTTNNDYRNTTHVFKDRTGSFTALNMTTATAVFTSIPVVPNYTAAAANAITGQIGAHIAISDSAGGSHPNGMLAFWDTTNSRWSYIHDNSAV